MFQHRELRKEQASLARVEMPLSSFLYLSVAPVLAPDEIRKVGQWRAEERCSAGRKEGGERWETKCCTWKISANALN